MYKMLFCAGFLIAAAIVSPRPAWAGGLIGRIDVIFEDHPRWEIALVDGEIGFIGGWTASKPGAKDTRPTVEIPSDKGELRLSPGVYKNDDTLQVYVEEYIREASKTQAEKHMWYLTGDYSGKEPALKLTKKMEKYSHWEFVAVGEPTGRKDHEPVQQYFIKNLNDLGKDAWLSMEKTPGVRYKNAGEFRKATLSFDRQGFSVPLGATGK
jgi:hypothetical protein